MRNWISVYDSVSWFAHQMRQKLWKHREKRFWLGHPDFHMSDARTRLNEELVELDEAIATEDWAEVVREAADVANFAMMIAQMGAELDGQHPYGVQ